MRSEQWNFHFQWVIVFAGEHHFAPKPLNQLRETKTHMPCLQINFVLPWLKDLKVLFFLWLLGSFWLTILAMAYPDLMVNPGMVNGKDKLTEILPQFIFYFWIITCALLSSIAIVSCKNTKVKIIFVFFRQLHVTVRLHLPYSWRCSGKEGRKLKCLTIVSM